MSLRHVTLHQLRIFRALAEEMNFTRAAATLHLTQPALSIQIKQLSEALGVPLYEISGRRMMLTPAGQLLKAACLDVFGRLASLEMELAELQGLERGSLRIAIVTTAKYFLPSLLGEFCRVHPRIDVALKVTNREKLLARLAANEDDLYVLGQPPEGSAVCARPVRDNPLVVVARADHPLVGEAVISPARLAQEPLLMRESGSGTRLALERWFEAHGLTPRVRMELGSNEAIKQAIVGGLGIAVLSLHTLQLDMASGHFAILPVEGFPIRRRWYAVHRRDKHLSPAACAFLDLLLASGKEEAGEMSPAPC